MLARDVIYAKLYELAITQEGTIEVAKQLVLQALLCMVLHAHQGSEDFSSSSVAPLQVSVSTMHVVGNSG